MFGLQKYIYLIDKIKWYFPSQLKDELEQILYVDFGFDKTHYYIQKVKFSYVDILLGLEDLDFELTKSGEDVMIKILKI